MKLSHNHQVRGLQILTHLVGVPAIIWAVMEGRWDLLLVAWLTYWVVGTLGINVGMHRYWSHSQFKTYRPIEYILAFCGVITTVGSPMAWSVVHRLHHRFTDEKHDPHNPHDIGPIRAWLGLWNTSGFKYSAKSSKGLTRDPLLKNTHRYYIEIIIAYNVVLLAIDPILIPFVYCIPAMLALHSACGIIVIPHYHGYKLWETGDSSRNSWIANIVTMGEGWHNTHHKYPGRWNTRVKWWEWDLPAQIIKVIRKDRRLNRSRDNDDLKALLKLSTRQPINEVNSVGSTEDVFIRTGSEFGSSKGAGLPNT